MTIVPIDGAHQRSALAAPGITIAMHYVEGCSAHKRAMAESKCQPPEIETFLTIVTENAEISGIRIRRAWYAPPPARWLNFYQPGSFFRLGWSTPHPPCPSGLGRTSLCAPTAVIVVGERAVPARHAVAKVATSKPHNGSDAVNAI
jgi:hypothetical protein